MSDSVKERLKFFIKTQKLSNKRFEEICGLSNGYISSMRKSIGPDSWEKIKKQYPNLNRDWMLYGEGTMLEMEKPEPPKETPEPPKETPEPPKETPTQNKVILGGENFSPATDSGNVRIDVGSPELAIEVGALQIKLKDALDKIKEKDQYIADLKNHIADPRDMINTLKIQIESLKASRQ